MLTPEVKLIIVIVGVALIVYTFVLSPLRLVMYVVAFQKIIDIFWFVDIYVGGVKLNIQRIVYTLLPAILALVLLALSYGRVRKYPFSTKIAPLMVFFAVIVTIGFLRSPFPESASVLFAKLIAPFVMFGAGWYYFDTAEKFDHFGRLYVWSYIVPFIGLLLQLTGIFQLADIGVAQMTYADVGLEEKAFRYAGFYADSGTMAMPLYVLVPLCYYFLSKSDEPNQQRYWLFILMAVVVAAASFVRGVVLGAGIVTVVWLWLNRRWGLLGLFLAVALPLFFLTDFSRKFFSDIFAILEGGLWAASLSGRTGIWYRLLDSFENQSFADKFFGGGILRHSLDINLIYDGKPGSAHADVLEFMYDLGYLGLGVYLILILSLWILILKNLQRCATGKYDKNLVMKYFVWVTILAFYTYGIFGWSSRWTALTFPFWFLAGFALKPPAYYAAQAKAAQEQAMYIELNPRLSPY
jgi:hypothetical protein